MGLYLTIGEILKACRENHVESIIALRNETNTHICELHESLPKTVGLDDPSPFLDQLKSVVEVYKSYVDKRVEEYKHLVNNPQCSYFNEGVLETIMGLVDLFKSYSNISGNIITAGVRSLWDTHKAKAEALSIEGVRTERKDVRKILSDFLNDEIYTIAPSELHKINAAEETATAFKELAAELAREPTLTPQDLTQIISFEDKNRVGALVATHLHEWDTNTLYDLAKTYAEHMLEINDPDFAELMQATPPVKPTEKEATEFTVPAEPIAEETTELEYTLPEQATQRVIKITDEECDTLEEVSEQTRVEQAPPINKPFMECIEGLDLPPEVIITGQQSSILKRMLDAQHYSISGLGKCPRVPSRNLTNNLNTLRENELVRKTGNQFIITIKGVYAFINCINKEAAEHFQKVAAGASIAESLTVGAEAKRVLKEYGIITDLFQLPLRLEQLLR